MADWQLMLSRIVCVCVCYTCCFLLMVQCCCRYPLLRGDSDLVQLLKLLQPKVLVPLLNADLVESGQLKALMSVKGSSAAAVLRQRLTAAGVQAKLEYPAPPGESLAIAL